MSKTLFRAITAFVLAYSIYCQSAEKQKGPTGEKNRENEKVEIDIKSGIYKIDTSKTANLDGPLKKAASESRILIIDDLKRAEKAVTNARPSDSIANKIDPNSTDNGAKATIDFAKRPTSHITKQFAITKVEIMDKKGDDEFVAKITVEGPIGRIERYDAELTRIGNSFVCDKHGEVESNAARRRAMTQQKGCLWVAQTGR